MQLASEFLKAELARYKNLQFTHSAIEPQVRGGVAWVAYAAISFFCCATDLVAICFGSPVRQRDMAR